MPIVRLLIAVFAAAAGGALFTPVASAIQPAPANAPSAARGGQLFLQCRACHAVAPGAPNAVGPNLAGIFGAKAGTRPGYAFSPALAKSGLMWNAASLDSFLERPSQAVPGTKMAYAGVADAKVRADLIAYLATLKAKK